MLVKLVCAWEKVPTKRKLSTAAWVQALRENRKQVRFTQSSGSAADWLLEVREEMSGRIPALRQLSAAEWRNFAVVVQTQRKRGCRRSEE